MQVRLERIWQMLLYQMPGNSEAAIHVKVGVLKIWVNIQQKFSGGVLFR